MLIQILRLIGPIHRAFLLFDNSICYDIIDSRKEGKRTTKRVIRLGASSERYIWFIEFKFTCLVGLTGLPFCLGPSECSQMRSILGNGRWSSDRLPQSLVLMRPQFRCLKMSIFPRHTFLSRPASFWQGCARMLVTTWHLYRFRNRRGPKTAIIRIAVFSRNKGDEILSPPGRMYKRRGNAKILSPVGRMFYVEVGNIGGII